MHLTHKKAIGVAGSVTERETQCLHAENRQTLYTAGGHALWGMMRPLDFILSETGSKWQVLSRGMCYDLT